MPSTTPMTHLDILVLAAVLLGVAIGMLGLALMLLAVVERRQDGRPPHGPRPTRRGHARNGTTPGGT